MKIGIVGTGLIGGTLARQLARAGHKVMISFTKTVGKLEAIAEEIGVNISIGIVGEATTFGDVVILSVGFKAMNLAISQMGNVAGKVIISTSNQYEISLPEGTAAMEVNKRLPGVHLVKAFNTHHYSELLTKAFNYPLYAMPFSGDYAEANKLAAEIISSIGFAPIYVGPLSKVAIQEMRGALFGKSLTLEQAAELLKKNT